MDKRDRAVLFRARLVESMDRAGLTRSALARAAGVDRSTIGQLLSAQSVRLPGAGLVADAAGVLGVSADWLLGLTDRPERPGDIVAAAMAVSPAERSAADAKIMGWHREAEGFKIRHVPATLPDILKTPDMLRWEYGARNPGQAGRAIAAQEEQLAWLRESLSDYEMAVPVHEVRACARGAGYYEDAPAEIRAAQLAHIAQVCDTLYPRLRLTLYDAREVFSAPMTVFGPALAVLYVGAFFLAFRDRARIRSLVGHFDGLVRAAEGDARDVGAALRSLAERA